MKDKEDLDDLKALRKFTLICKNCKGENIELEDSRGYSEVSGGWGELDIVCVDCENRETLLEGDQ